MATTSVESNCLDGAGSITKCYCGTLTAQTCASAAYDLAQPGAPNGPCALVMQQGTHFTTNQQMLAGFTSLSRPTGDANRRLQCQKNDPTCAPLCGVQ